MKKIPDNLLKQMAKAYDAEHADLSYFRGGHDWSDGILYEYSRDGRTHILKIMELPAGQAQESLSALEARLQFIRFLGERGIGIVHPEPAADGRLFVKEQEEERIYAAYGYIKRDGVHLFERPVAEHEALFARWGEVMGQMHAAAQEYPVWREIPGDQEHGILHWEKEWHGFHEWCKDEAVKESWRRLKDKLDRLPLERGGFGFTHNDLHIENLLANQGTVTVLDFDVSNLHWFACDLAVAVYSILTYASAGQIEGTPQDPGRLRQLYRSFIEGYLSANPLDDFWLAQIPLFLQYRRILLFVVFAEGLAQSDPEHYRLWRQRILEETPFPNYN
ncbi:phosphotransferase enzyme family protein [Paenibacillus sp. NFR01]|uniref:phosphotransferase enzyme family protein n=1 Tax=Paenibacillus sp. NFR01 TaxID=1566279 RepID=UPI0008C4A273|nr:phosphotransferase [Paenibacillus sp. NFR01]SEU28221.1 Ser/Thr protein kinase RdoA involved in Cpx stress response, MazF antagonist [Paenibacillus sp. NFR01]